MASDITHSYTYEDNEYKYMHVSVSLSLRRKIPKDRLMTETEWRFLGVMLPAGWEHYMIHRPEPHILLFRCKKNK
ncbi:cyclin-dependent kinases regulatory subunit-like [Bicyclus anynana]|uniref:Cyclin-dependent kinases regulatory subunit n=1 Tax=Bicyclus anynana TaxID=110368 RepID=A0A6J1MZ62_BICAN|nr:cyclin-dependent kinases regulatory subunit-like [Bicyclus anynana]